MSRRIALGVGLTLLVVYFAVQIYVSMHPPIRKMGNRIFPARPGQQLVLGLNLRNVYRLPVTVSSVAIDREKFILEDVCVIKHDSGPLFGGSLSPELPPEDAQRCHSIKTIDTAWTFPYSLAIRGTVVSVVPDEATTGTLTYWFMGWPHKVRFQGELLRPAPD